MRKTSLIALISFAVGLLLAAFIFVYYPERETQAALQETPLSEELSANLYASPGQQPRKDLDFATIAERVSPAVVYIIAEKVEKVRTIGFLDSQAVFRYYQPPIVEIGRLGGSAALGCALEGKSANTGLLSFSTLCVPGYSSDKA